MKSKFKPYERDQQQFLPPSVDQYVSEDALPGFIVQQIEALDLSAFTDQYSLQGNAGYHPALMLALWVLAYSEGITSTRMLEQRCKRDLHYMYAAAGEYPDHTSLARFRKRHAADFPEIFFQVVRGAMERGFSEFNRIHIDGSKVHADASRSKGRTQAALEEEIAALDEQLEAYFEACDQEDGAPDHVLAADDDLPPDPPAKKQETREDLVQKREQRKALRDELIQRKTKIKSEHRARHQINLTDPEARNMTPVNQVKGAPAYHVQATVDAESKLLTAADVVNQPNDYGQFSAMHQKCEAVLHPDESREHNADSGYRKYFNYDSIDDVYRCPEGQVLRPVKTRNAHGRQITTYQSSDCTGGCLKNGSGTAHLCGAILVI